MDTQLNTAMSSFVYNRIPTQVSRKDFHRYIAPHLQRPKTGPKPKLSLYKIFNYILYVLHTGIQWDQLKTKRHELGVDFSAGRAGIATKMRYAFGIPRQGF